MKNVIAFIGSNRGKNSNTVKFTQLIFEKLVELSNGQVTYEIISSADVKIEECKGCCACFKTGICPQEKIDSMNMLKSKFINADLVVIGSPVYAHSISSSTKLFIDRISSWLHLFRLNNKLSFSVSTSSTNGNVYVDKYLQKMLEFLGTTYINNFSCTVDSPACLENELFINVEIKKYATKILNALNSESYVKSSQMQEGLYLSLKSNMKSVENNGVYNSEVIYWKESGLLDSKSYDEYLVRNKFIKKGEIVL